MSRSGSRSRVLFNRHEGGSATRKLAERSGTRAAAKAKSTDRLSKAPRKAQKYIEIIGPTKSTMRTYQKYVDISRTYQMYEVRTYQKYIEIIGPTKSTMRTYQKYDGTYQKYMKRSEPTKSTVRSYQKCIALLGPTKSTPVSKGTYHKYTGPTKSTMLFDGPTKSTNSMPGTYQMYLFLYWKTCF
jgi:hypothetical protein